MSIICLVGTDRLTLATDRLVFDANETDALSDAAAHAESLSTLLDSENDRIRTAEEQGYRDGHARGQQQGRADIQAKLTSEWLAATDSLHAATRQTREQSVHLALAIVRRIAGEIDETRLLASLASKAAEDLLPDEQAELSVHPAMLEGVEKRLSTLAGVPFARVIGDDQLKRHDCVIRTAEGTLAADLDTHLQALEKYFHEH
ncbi:MAG: hypothetical protein CSB44_01330 [Gammaproteobacteria bacterium]|nr:MAG: hypothetical protein CSB44_01330 [Gammaproteobacteria bacterium]